MASYSGKATMGRFAAPSRKPFPTVGRTSSVEPPGRGDGESASRPEGPRDRPGARRAGRRKSLNSSGLPHPAVTTSQGEERAMIMLASRHRPSLRRALIVPAFALALAAPPPGARASTLLAPKGQKATLEYTIDIEGKASGTNNNYQSQQWSTRRSLVVRATLIAQQPSRQDPGEPGGPHRGASPPKGEAFQPSPEMAAFMAELEKCGEDMACRARLTQKMMQDPKIQADVQKAKNAGESLSKGSPRYQIWLADRKTPATGTLKTEVQREQLFKTRP